MKVLMWHCAKFRLGNINHSHRIKAIDHRNNDISEQNVIVPWITVESEKDIFFLDDVIQEIEKMSATYNTKLVVITPFGHLSNTHCNKKKAYEILQTLTQRLVDKMFAAQLAHFGSYKDVEFLSEAHPEQVKFRTYPKPVYSE